jgi:molybdopterin converting factor small subunit
MSKTIRIHQAMRHLTGNQPTVDVNGATVGECLKEMVARFPDIKSKLFDKKDTLLNYVEIYVNAKTSYPEELAMPVKDGDVLTIILMIAGG